MMRSTTRRPYEHMTNSPADSLEAPHILAGRLATGWVMIETESSLTKRAKLEDHWIRLLHAYEDACDQTGGAS